MEASQEQARVHLRIAGRVQGVYFRAATVTEAQRLGVTGWVMNRPDGAVEAVAEGARPNIEKLIAWCRHGPTGAKVTDVEVRWEVPQKNFSTFGIRR